ncbi:mycothiol synthase [Gordonia iterans]|uniref:Mycothiol acetyltransferase n=1 Tax=Gordonia iterans TaxID=1004901 RepID=A0A2S0KDA7_9ACTN|nr:mycothiol synthase [Gordonia iterans]AVL99659.1 mycothiol synthase [Gordonia iterans]
MTASSALRTVRGPLSDADLTAVRALVARAEAHDGVAPLSEQFRLALTAPESLHLLSPHGYAGIVVPPAGGAAAVEATVDPEHRSRGEGSRLVAAALGAAREAGEGAPALWAHGDLAAAAGLAANLELDRVRELLQLRRPLAPADPAAIPLPPLPTRDDVVLRTYLGPGDDAEILRVNNAAFSWHPEQGGWTQAQLDDRTGADWFDPAGLFLAVDADSRQLLGFHWTKVHPASETGGDPLGEVYVVAVDPGAQGRGLGGLLTLAGLHHLAGRDLREVQLYVEGDNAAALATYRRLGFGRHAVDAAYR